ncbi:MULTISPECIES: hypothetical protein [Streptomyces]
MAHVSLLVTAPGSNERHGTADLTIRQVPVRTGRPRPAPAFLRFL